MVTEYIMRRAVCKKLIMKELKLSARDVDSKRICAINTTNYREDADCSEVLLTPGQKNDFSYISGLECPVQKT